MRSPHRSCASSILRSGALIIFVVAIAGNANAREPRARDLGVSFPGETGVFNAITDVEGVEVGHTTIIRGDGALVVGVGPVRTGVTAIHPRGKNSTEPVFAGWFALNGSGEMTGTTWIEERGLLDGPVLITNTHSVGVVRDAAVAWMVETGWSADWHAPVVAETYDGGLNDTNGFHVTKEHALEAMRSAVGGDVTEGAVGGGTGMECNSFKGGIGSSSRKIAIKGNVYTVGVLVQCNYGWRTALRQIAGVPVDALQKAPDACYEDRTIKIENPSLAYCDEGAPVQLPPEMRSRDGSIIIVVATDAPLLPHQLRRLAKRPSMGLGRLGATSRAGSGDIFIAFSTARLSETSENELSTVTMFPNNLLSGLFEATAQATEEAVVNAMVAAKTMVGINGTRVPELPEETLAEIMSAHAASQ